MRNAVIGLIIGIVAGIVLGTTVIAPRLAHNVKQEIGLTDSAAPGAPAAATDSQKTDKETDQKSTTTPPAPAVVAETAATGPALRVNMASTYAEALAGHGTLARRLEKNVWRISDGSLDIRFNPPGALVKDGEALDAVISGAIDAYFTDMDVLAARDPAMSLLAGPPFGASVAAYLGWMAGGGGREKLNERLAELGLGGMTCGIVPHAAGGWFKKPLKTTEDIKGLRIRANGLAAGMYERLGADVVDFSFDETLIALESGLLDGAQISAPHIDLALGAARGGWTYYMPGWRTPARVFILLMAEKKWTSLSEVQRAQLTTACSDNIRHAIAEGEALQFEALKQIIKSGADVQPWPVEITDAMHKTWDEMAQEMQKSSRPYSRVQKSWRQFIKGQSIWEELVRPK
ncbi:TRAP transporter substrate-binding protein DctP [Thalassospiraceae bacterium LMO-JJ14]|nr:TRAP transporter substrate-binding protein DctP [Thalassospiraceae bacterium LMO-JJ14]